MEQISNTGEFSEAVKATALGSPERYRLGQQVFNPGAIVGQERDRSSWLAKAIRSRRHANPLMPYTADILPWTLYDRISLSNGTTSARKYQFFVTQQGQSSKTKVDTNMEDSGVLASPQVMNMTHLGFYPADTVLRADLSELLEDYWVEFKIGGKIYAEGKLSQFPGGAGLDAFTTVNNEAAYKIGVPIAGNCWDLRLPRGMELKDTDGATFMTDGIIGQIVPDGEKFEVDILSDNTFTVASNPLNFYCFIYGILSRGVR